MLQESDEWENMFLAPGTPDNILLVSFKSEALRPLTGKTVGEIAKMRGTRPEFTIMDLIVEDESRIGTIYFSQSEDVVRKAVALPWVSFNWENMCATKKLFHLRKLFASWLRYPHRT
jgi:N-acyl-D-amino-acid deacylase